MKDMKQKWTDYGTQWIQGTGEGDLKDGKFQFG